MIVALLPVDKFILQVYLVQVYFADQTGHGIYADLKAAYPSLQSS